MLYVALLDGVVKEKERTIQNLKEKKRKNQWMKAIED